MPKNATIERLAANAPVRHEPIHQRREPLGVIALQQVHQFMHHDVFQTKHRLFGQFQIEPGAPGRGVAA